MGNVYCGTNGEIRADKHMLANGQELGKCYAWVNFNGTGTIAIRKSLNVSSISDNGTGDYTVNFTTALPDANYCFCLSTQDAGGSGSAPYLATASSALSPTVSALAIRVKDGNAGTLRDTAIITASIFD